jgi:hypothetical protein
MQRPAILNFPLFHGTSTHYLEFFQSGSPPKACPFRDQAIELLRKVSDAIKDAGGEIKFWIRDTLAQASGASNWQHGEIYLTPSLCTASKYARTGGAHGGELLTMCACSLSKLAEIDPDKSMLLRTEASDLQKFLNGGGKPMLVVFENVNVDDLNPERASETMDDVLERLPQKDNEFFGLLTQQTNFRLKLGRSVINRTEIISES